MILDRLERLGAVVDPVADVMEPLALVGQVLGHRGVVTGRREELDVAVGHLDQRLLDPVGVDALPVGDGRPEGVGVVGDGRLQVVDGDRHVIDLGQLGSGHAPCLLNKVIRSSPTSARNSGSSMPSPSSGARHSTPILPSWRFWWTWYAASPTPSSGCTAESGGRIF